MLITIDNHSGVPIYRQILEQVKRQILGGRLAGGFRDYDAGADEKQVFAAEIRRVLKTAVGAYPERYGRINSPESRNGRKPSYAGVGFLADRIAARTALKGPVVYKPSRRVRRARRSARRRARRLISLGFS